jgi:hypothetical protein
MTKVPAVVNKTKEVKNFLETFKDIARDYATREYDVPLFLKTALLCIMDSPDLQKCISTPTGQNSLYHALRYAA